MDPNGALLYKLTWKIGHLDIQDTYGWSQGVHNTRHVPLYAVRYVHDWIVEMDPIHTLN